MIAITPITGYLTLKQLRRLCEDTSQWPEDSTVTVFISPAQIAVTKAEVHQ